MEVNTYRRGLGEIVKRLYLLRCNNRMVNKIKTRKIQVERRVGYCITQHLETKRNSRDLLCVWITTNEQHFTSSFSKYFLSPYYGNIIRHKPCSPDAQLFIVRERHANKYVCLSLGCMDRNSPRLLKLSVTNKVVKELHI